MGGLASAHACSGAVGGVGRLGGGWRVGKGMRTDRQLGNAPAIKHPAARRTSERALARCDHAGSVKRHRPGSPAVQRRFAGLAQHAAQPAPERLPVQPACLRVGPHAPPPPRPTTHWPHLRARRAQLLQPQLAILAAAQLAEHRAAGSKALVQRAKPQQQPVELDLGPLSRGILALLGLASREGKRRGPAAGQGGACLGPIMRSCEQAGTAARARQRG